jgi:EAL domain-containing protein (putative c-di-GMP-specific phosphodiesterase class I)/GGDEF domain-containing protein
MKPAGREALIARLEESLQRRRDRNPNALIVLRLRKLATIGSLMGEGAVQRILDSVVARLSEFGRATDLVADLGEGTYAAICTDAEGDLEELTERMIAAVSRQISFGECLLYAPANAGICPLDAAQGDAEAHLERAMRALQQAMSKGPGAIALVSHARVERDVDDWGLRSLLEEAGLRGEFSLEYQTIQACDGSNVRKVEALLRWDSPTLGRVGPDRFIPVLEESGLIRPIGEWVLRQACLQIRQWRIETGLPLRVAVNVSPVQVISADFESAAQRVLAETLCEAQWIELEITEGALIRNFARIKPRLESLAAMGFTLAIDDFGAGYSSLGQLAQLPVHHLKMDRSLIDGMPDGSKRAGIVTAVIALAEELDLAVTSEGVETAEQASWLARFPAIRCQGYLFARPMTAERIRPLLGLATPAAARPTAT